MGPIAVLIGVLGGGIAKLLSVETAKFLATRALILSLVTLVLPVVLYNVFTEILEEYLTYVSGLVTAEGFTGSIIELTGMGAWIAQEIQLPASLALFISALGFKWIIGFFRR